jgi:hypothetical protein
LIILYWFYKVRHYQTNEATNHKRIQTCRNNRLHIIAFIVSKSKHYDGRKLARWLYNYRTGQNQHHCRKPFKPVCPICTMQIDIITIKNSCFMKIETLNSTPHPPPILVLERFMLLSKTFQKQWNC